MWGPSRAKKGLDLCPEQGKDLSLSLSVSPRLPISRAPSRFDVLFWTLREIDLADFFCTLRYIETNSRAARGDCENRSRILFNLSALSID